MVAAAVAAVAIAVVAVADHRHTRTRLDHADIASWFCTQRGTRCAESKPGPIHDRWEIREYGYKAAEGILALSFLSGGFRLVRLRHVR
jgi:hypothetical protein